MYGVSSGDYVRVCYDGKGGRARKAIVLKTEPRHGKKKRILVEFYEWGAENPRLIKQWFRWRPANTERDGKCEEEYYSGKFKGRRKAKKLPIIWRKAVCIEHSWTCHQHGRYEAYVKNEASIGVALFGWAGDFYSLYPLSGLKEWSKEFQDSFWSYGEDANFKTSESEKVVVQLREAIQNAGGMI
jgi:hypothetical protein